MKIEDFVKLRLDENQDVMVEAANGNFYGKFINLTNDGSRLQLGEVQAEDGRKCGKLKFFFRKDVNVKVVSVVGSETASSSSGSAEISASPVSSRSFTSIESNSSCTLAEAQQSQILKSIDSCVYIQQGDVKYFDAIADISNNFVIGIGAEGVGQGRIFDTNFVTISTANNIYVFDVLALGTKRIASDLKNILESEQYLKVAYDCRGLKDNLKVKLGLKLEPVYDLFLVSALFFKPQKVMGLNNCIESVLGIHNVVSDKGVSMTRPVSSDNLRDIATKTAYHLAMHHKLVQKDFTKRMLESSRNFLNESYSSDGCMDRLKCSETDKNLNETLKMQSQVKTRLFDFNIYSSD